MILFKFRIAALASTARIHVAGELVTLGLKLHAALTDLAVLVEPRLYRRPVDRAFRPWLGAMVLALLVLGLLSAGTTGLWIAREALPHRAARP